MAEAAHAEINALLATFTSSFQSEWRKQGRSAPLQSIAIVDASPNEQYLYPEFVLFQRLFERHGIAAIIAAPEQLELRTGGLWFGGQHLDLVYNRLNCVAVIWTATWS